MGQILGKLQGMGAKANEEILAVRDVERANLRFEDLYYWIFQCDINKRLPGPHFDPPSKDRVQNMIIGTFLASIMDCNVNLDRETDREEFMRFIPRLRSDTIIVVNHRPIATLVMAPTDAMVKKRTADGLPNSVYASLVTMAVVLCCCRSQSGRFNIRISSMCCYWISTSTIQEV
ncbi:hypothetical protein ACJRO7_020514 [Eucalyptus globulus]|uniref:Uncharacterized protein n=1 Tax=Eucalyptus globulus TaxID=34317 RepID=A0ABD3KGX9_EUCGL